MNALTQFVYLAFLLAGLVSLSDAGIVYRDRRAVSIGFLALTTCSAGAVTVAGGALLGRSTAEALGGGVLSDTLLLIALLLGMLIVRWFLGYEVSPTTDAIRSRLLSSFDYLR